MKISIFRRWTHFHNEGGPGPKCYFLGFFRAPQNLFVCQISRWSDTPFRFLPIYTQFLANMWRKYFSFNIWTVVYQSELELSDFDQNWAKTRPLLLKTLELPISIAWPIVQCGNIPLLMTRSKISTSSKKVKVNPCWRQSGVFYFRTEISDFN